MKRTLQEQKEITFIQYILESLIEYYEVAQKESDRYYIISQFLDFIEDAEVNLEFLRSYLSLQPDKFKPFIKVLDNTKETFVTKKKDSCFSREPAQIKMYAYRK